jgi:hypothetical protein
VAEALFTNFFWCFGVPQELYSDEGHNFESRPIQVILEHLGVSKIWTTPLHPQSDSIVERYTKMAEDHLRKVTALHQRDWNARSPIFLLANRAFTFDTTRLTLACLMFGRELPALQPAIWGIPRQEATTRHPWLCPPTPKAGQWLKENSARLPGKTCGLPGRQQSVALLPKLQKGEVVQAPILMGKPIQGSCPDKWYSVQDPEEPKNKDDGGTHGLAHTLSENCFGWAALRREQLDKLKDHSMPPNTQRREAGNPWNWKRCRCQPDSRVTLSKDNYRCHRHVPSGKKKWWYTCRLLRTSSLNVGAAWQYCYIHIV